MKEMPIVMGCGASLLRSLPAAPLPLTVKNQKTK